MKLNLTSLLGLLLTFNLTLTSCGQKQTLTATDEPSNPKVEEPEYPESEPVTMDQFNEFKTQVEELKTTLHTLTLNSEQKVTDLEGGLNQRLTALEAKLGNHDQLLQKQADVTATNITSLNAIAQDFGNKIATKESQIQELSGKIKIQQIGFDSWTLQKEQQLKTLEQANQLLSGQLTELRSDFIKSGETLKNITQRFEDNTSQLQKSINELDKQEKVLAKEYQSKFDELASQSKKITELQTQFQTTLDQNKSDFKSQLENGYSGLLNVINTTKAEMGNNLKIAQNQIQERLNNHAESIKILEGSNANQNKVLESFQQSAKQTQSQIFTRLEQMNVADQQNTDRLKTNEANILVCQKNGEAQADQLKIISSVVSGTATGLRKSDTAIADINKRLSPMQFVNVENKPSIVFNGVNVHIRNGAGLTYNTNNGLGNLILGYNEQPTGSNFARSGSHNILVGQNHEYLSTASLVVGVGHRVEGHSNAIVGGVGNQITAAGAVIIGGKINKVTEPFATSVGGSENQVRGQLSVNIGGHGNVIEGTSSVTLGGYGNNIKPTATFGASLGGSRNSIESIYGTTVDGTENNVSKDAIGGLILGGIKQSVSQLYQTLIGSN